MQVNENPPVTINIMSNPIFHVIPIVLFLLFLVVFLGFGAYFQATGELKFDTKLHQTEIAKLEPDIQALTRKIEKYEETITRLRLHYKTEYDIVLKREIARLNEKNPGKNFSAFWPLIQGNPYEFSEIRSRIKLDTFLNGKEDETY